MLGLMVTGIKTSEHTKKRKQAVKQAFFVRHNLPYFFGVKHKNGCLAPKEILFAKWLLAMIFHII